MIVTGDLRKTRTKHYRFIDIEEAEEIAYEVFNGQFVYYQPHRIIFTRTDGAPVYAFNVRAKSRRGHDMIFTFATEQEYVSDGVRLAPQWMLDLLAEDLTA